MLVQCIMYTDGISTLSKHLYRLFPGWVGRQSAE